MQLNISWSHIPLKYTVMLTKYEIWKFILRLWAEIISDTEFHGETRKNTFYFQFDFQLNERNRPKVPSEILPGKRHIT